MTVGRVVVRGSDLDGDALMAQQLDARPSLLPTTPVPQQPQRSRPNDERMQKHTHLAGLGGRTAIPLTLLAQRAGTTTANAGRIHHAQASISLSAVDHASQRLAACTQDRSRAARRSLADKRPVCQDCLPWCCHEPGMRSVVGDRH